ncbi:DUF6477 family protein [Pleomorphomonas koreensis]|uniref:DUF6477 family protein n=1 Tax=Pleomorphomonas koreensis TaxID=257440 RepID=UPI00248186E5|nr:DUF6477 family protein [Pleomorphomonas koreensis]
MRESVSIPPVASLVADSIDAGVLRYRRQEMLPRLLPVDPADIADDSEECTRKLCLRLLSALRRERGRGRAGHWSYDLNRHIGLLQAYRAERRTLRRRAGTSGDDQGAS